MDIHISTNWQISDTPFNDPKFTNATETHLVFDNINLVNKTQVKLDPGILKPDTDYYLRVSYSDLYGWSEWSNWTGDEKGIKFTTRKDETDKDLNGIPDDQDIVGFVDLDNNGEDDHTQLDVVAMKSIVSSVTVGLQTSSGEVSFARTENSEDLPEKPAEHNFPDGVFNFRVERLAQGEEIEVTFYLSHIFSTNDKWYKYNASTGWQDYTGRITSGIGTNKITLAYKDGDYGDADGAENGVIVDPSGPAYKNSNAGGGTPNPIPPPLLELPTTGTPPSSGEPPTSGAPPVQSIASSEWSGGGMCFIGQLAE